MGKQEKENFGYAIAMNFDGSRVVVGAPKNDDDKYVDRNSGCVRIFDLDSDRKVWLQIGEIKGNTKEEGAGYNLDMTANGQRLAIFGTASRMENNSDLSNYYFNGFKGEISIWDINPSGQLIAVGQNIHGRAKIELIGFYSLHLSSSDGSTIIFNARSSTDESESQTRIYGYNIDANEWTQLGQDLPSPYTSNIDSSKISADGSRIAISSNILSHNATGQVQVFDYNSTKNTWDQVGETILEPTNNDSYHTMRNVLTDGNGFGSSIALSSDGNHLAIAMINPICKGDPTSPTKCDTGLVYLYVYDSTVREFRKIPDKGHSPIATTGTIEARPQKRDGMIFGFHLSFNADASRLSISSYDSISDQGIVNVYDLNELFYLNCLVPDPFEISNNICTPLDPFISEECGFDGGDCPQPVSVDGYPDCFVAQPERIDDGDCLAYLPYNSHACGYDGGDCPKPSPIEGYPGCVAIPGLLGNGYCDAYLPYNTEECGWDGGDCI